MIQKTVKHNPQTLRHTSRDTNNYTTHSKERGYKRMTTLGVSGIMFQCVFDGSLSMHTEIERRPYHKNCNCALHTSKQGCANSCPQQGNISFPKKQSQTDGSLCMSISSNFQILRSSQQRIHVHRKYRKS